MDRESKIFYPARGTTIRDGQCEGKRTKYGWTSRYWNLELHIGDHLYRKRGGLHKAFLFDPYDYRYQTLAKSLGVNAVQPLGGLIGYYHEKDGDMIKFRVTEQDPTHVVFCYKYEQNLVDDLSALKPEAITVAHRNSCAYAVFTLDRLNDTPELYEDYDDDYYDWNPDEADLVHDHAHEELDQETIIETRLKLCGFVS